MSNVEFVTELPLEALPIESQPLSEFLDNRCSDLLCAEDPSIDGCPCNDPVQGPTEIDKSSQVDMGLTDEDIRDLTLGWNLTMEGVQRAVLERHGYTWSLILGQQNANASPRMLTQASCRAALRLACKPDSDWQQHSLLFGLRVNGTALAQVLATACRALLRAAIDSCVNLIQH